MNRKWIVQIKGKKYSDNFEISLVRECNATGQLFWGKFGKDKLLISNSPYVNSLTEKVWKRTVRMAKELAEELNIEEKKLLKK